MSGKNLWNTRKRYSIAFWSWKYLVVTVLLLEWSHNNKTFPPGVILTDIEPVDSQLNTTLNYITHLNTTLNFLTQQIPVLGSTALRSNQAHHQWIKFFKIWINFSPSSRYEHRATICLTHYCSSTAPHRAASTRATCLFKAEILQKGTNHLTRKISAVTLKLRGQMNTELF